MSHRIVYRWTITKCHPLDPPKYRSHTHTLGWAQCDVTSLCMSSVCSYLLSFSYEQYPRWLFIDDEQNATWLAHQNIDLSCSCTLLGRYHVIQGHDTSMSMFIFTVNFSSCIMSYIIVYWWVITKTSDPDNEYVTFQIC